MTTTTRGTTARRRSNKKSRYGCTQCKQRHIKCDESRPSCVNCKTCNRECSYLTTLTVRKVTIPTTLPASPTIPATPSLSPHYYGTIHLNNFLPTAQVPGIDPPSTNANEQVFKLHHLELLNHFKSDMLKDMALGESQAERFVDMAVRQAVQTPYLMDQILAISALHTSIKQPSRESFWRNEATSLQTRALASFNVAKIIMKEDTCQPVFLFSILLSHHVIFDTLSIRADFPFFLHKLVSCLHICGGIKTIAGQFWGTLETQFGQRTVSSPAQHRTPRSDVSSRAAKISRLEYLLTNTDLSPPHTDACVEALSFLQLLCDKSSHDCEDGAMCQTNLTLGWLVRVSPCFVSLLEQRRPEALIILAYYAVALHEARNYWVFGDAGRYIIQEVTRFLGSYWADWLVWPNEVLSRTEDVGTG
ncbi:hypothetical protein F4810DRAFT_128849 [Camillea tinctor]|nr:hypothetical protein F4810DRAFT_128849 [Camillea tinctor]